MTVATQTTTTIIRRKRYAFFSFVSLGLLHWRQCLFTFPLPNTPRVKGLKHKIESSVQYNVCDTMMQCFKVNIALHAKFIFSNVNTPCLFFSFFFVWNWRMCVQQDMQYKRCNTKIGVSSWQIPHYFRINKWKGTVLDLLYVLKIMNLGYLES